MQVLFIALVPAAPFLRTLSEGQAAPSASAAVRFQGQRCVPSYSHDKAYAAMS